jgi:acetylornithine/succinyldiaminopimelate/putrescine aminotransferase
VDVRIGILNSPRELAFESTQAADELEKLVGDAVAAGTGHLSLSDEKGRRYLVPVAGIAYVELGSDQSRRVGFVA